MNQTLRLPTSLALILLFVLGLSSCTQDSTPETASAAGGGPAPLSELDLMINEYEKVTNDYVRVARKLKAGDVSVTIKLITDEQLTRQAAAKLQQESARMTPAQAQRVASISARAAPFLK